MIKQLPIKMPGSFETALGYPGDSRWAAFYWEPCGDEAMYDDGLCSGDGNWVGFLAFAEHPKVRPWLREFELGSSDYEARHWLLCDRESREVFVGEKEEVRAFLYNEAKKVLPETPVVEVSPEELHDLVLEVTEGLKEVPPPSMAEVEEKIRQDQAAIDKMVEEL